MFITSQIIFHLLSRKFSVSRWEQAAADVPIRMAKLYRGQPLEAENLYLLDELTDFTSFQPSDRCAFLILTSAPHMLPTSFRSTDVAFIAANVSKLDLFDELNNLLTALLEWDAALKDACYRGAQPLEIMELGRHFLPDPMILYDGEHHIICGGAEEQPKADAYDLYLDAGYRLHPGSEEVYLYPADGGEEKTLCKNILLDGQVIAVLLAFHSGSQVSAGALSVFAHLARYVTTAHLSNTACGRIRKKNDEQHKTLSRVLYQENYRLTPEDRAILARFGWQEEHEYRVTFMRPIRRVSSSLDGSYIRSRLENDWPESCVLPDGNNFVWVIDMTACGSSTRDIRKYLNAFIREQLLQVGLSNPMPGLFGLPNLYQQACSVLSIGSQKNPHLWLFEFGDYLLDYIFEKFSCELSAEQAVHSGIYRLMAYDAENGTDYVKTLQFYIENQFNASVAADKLYVHRSTFLRRIHRIEEISGIRLDDPDEVLHVMISLRLCQLMHVSKPQLP